MSARVFIRLTWLLAILSVVASVGVASQLNPPRVGFRWIDARHDRAIWTKIQSAFGDELRPDKADADTLTYSYKYIKSVGVADGATLVIIGYRIREHPTALEADFEYFVPFNYDMASGSVSQVIDPEERGLYLWHWKFVRLARLQSLTTPDIVFTYLSCVECEPEKLLGALHYSSVTHDWQIRQWGNGKPQWWMTPVGLVVGLDTSASSTISYDCLYGFLPFNGGRLEDVAIRCKEVTEDEQRNRHVTDSTVLYALKGNSFKGEVVTSKRGRLEIWSELCRSSVKNTLCRKAANYP